MSIIRKIRQKAKTEEFDYLFLADCLASYKQPRDKITKLVKNREVIRVKKGVYVFGKEYRQRPVSLEVLANLIYGPSYVSYEYALAYYNLIPEAVERVTSVCSKRNKEFTTPVGTFVYQYISPKHYPIGITLEHIDEHTHFLIATREKALADFVSRLKPFTGAKDLYEYLVESTRIDPSELSRFKPSLLNEISKSYQNQNVTFLCQALKK